MNSDPVNAALRHIIETRELLERVVISSERFDYRKAKTGLRQLEQKIKQLNRLQNRFEKIQGQPDPKICVVDFHASTAANE